MEKNSKIYVAGHNGMVGSAVVRKLTALGYTNIVTRTHKELDLCNQQMVADFFLKEQPEYVFLCAAKVGGILYNMEHPAEFLYDNLMIQANVIHQSYLHKVKKIIVLGSSCIYPRECKQPIKEEYLMTGPLEPTNEGYAFAKIAALKMAEFYNKEYGFNAISVMPCNLYGTNDNFDPQHSHVMPAMIKKFVDAVDNSDDTVTMWGTGVARREFMNVDDCANAIVFMMENYDKSGFINIGTGEDISIYDLAYLIANLTGFNGKILWDSTKPDGMMLKCLDVSKMKEIGFTPTISLEDGIRKMINEYKEKKR